MLAGRRRRSPRCIVPRRGVGDIARGAAQVLVARRADRRGLRRPRRPDRPRGPVMGIVLAFQLGVAPLLAQLDVLGDARLAIPAVAISRLDGAEGLVASLPLLGRDRDHPRLGRRRTRRRPVANPHPGDLDPCSLRAHAIPILVAILAVGIARCRSRRRSSLVALVPLYCARRRPRRCGAAVGAAAAIVARAAGRRWTTRLEPVSTRRARRAAVDRRGALHGAAARGGGARARAAGRGRRGRGAAADRARAARRGRPRRRR